MNSENHQERVDEFETRKESSMDCPIMDGQPQLPPHVPVPFFSVQLELPSYDVEYTLVVGTYAQCSTEGRRLFPEDKDFESPIQVEGLYAHDSRVHAIFLPTDKPVSLRTVLHECWHLTRGILAFRDADYGSDYDEHCALLHEHVTSWTIDTLKRRAIL